MCDSSVIDHSIFSALLKLLRDGIGDTALGRCWSICSNNRPSDLQAASAAARPRPINVCLLAFFSTVAHVYQKKYSYVSRAPLRGMEAEPQSAIFFRSWLVARRWVNLLTLWRMASAMLDLRLPSQPYGITVILWPIPNYTAWWQKRTCVNNLLVAESKTAGSRTCDLSESNTVTITSAGHPVLVYCPYFPHLL